MARALGRIAWGIHVVDERVGEDGSLVCTLRFSRLRIAYELAPELVRRWRA